MILSIDGTRNMKSILFSILLGALFFLQSCEKEKVDIFKQEYFYYTFDFEKIPLYLSGSRVFIEFNVPHSTDDISDFQNKYPFFSENPIPEIQTDYKRLRFNINAADTLQLQSYLKLLNRDTSITYAVPVFTFIMNKPETFTIPDNDIVCDPLISDDQLRKLISHYDLTIIYSKPEYPYYLFKINKVVTGFEPLDIANSLYETRKFTYCTPDFYSSFSPD
jgi:hypothetical protein